MSHFIKNLTNTGEIETFSEGIDDPSSFGKNFVLTLEMKNLSGFHYVFTIFLCALGRKGQF